MTVRRSHVSGHYAGAFTRLGASVIDWFVIIGSYAIILSASQFVADTFFRLDVNIRNGDPGWQLIGLAAWAFVYLAGGLTITGRSVGKALLGLKVVARDGTPLSAGRATIRVLAFPLNLLLFGLGFLGILLGKERRALHDVIAGCAVVYDWGDRPAELPAPISRWLARKGVAALPVEPAEGDAPATLTQP